MYLNGASADQSTFYAVKSASAYSQADPRSNVINSQVVWQPHYLFSMKALNLCRHSSGTCS